MILAEGDDDEWMLVFSVAVLVYFWSCKWIGPDPAKMDWSIITLTLVHFHNIVTMRDTIAVQMSKSKKYIYIYI